VEALLCEKELNEMEMRSQVMQVQREKAAVEETLQRVKRNYDAMRHEFNTL
jgi:hypothetical protein